MNPKSSLYVSLDIEADGPIPGQNSMLSIGAAAFTLDSREPIDTFEANLRRLPEAVQDPDTMKWWATQKEAWEYVQRYLMDPQDAMMAFREWLKNLPGKPTFVGYPATYDFMWSHWYLIKFTGEDPMGFSGMDLKTLASTLMGVPYHRAVKRNMPKKWFQGCPKHNHTALQDAIGQGIMFVNMMNDQAIKGSASRTHP